MSLTKTEKEIEHLREGGHRLASILAKLAQETVVGTTTRELDALAEKLIRAGGDTPAFLNYQPAGAEYPFPATLCISINDEVVHGIPGDRVIIEGDIVGLDLGLIHEGLIVDAAITVSVGTIDENVKRLLKVTEEALAAGIKAARGGGRVGDIGFAVESVVTKAGFGIIEELGGHGVGHKVHEEPYIANFGKKGTGKVLKPGMVLAIEPIVAEGSKRVRVAADGYTFMTRDGRRSAQFEHTILVTDGAAEILTKK